jgi:ring-1,2-phenylacetyl-CoA epoxidase subunit PaaC
MQRALDACGRTPASCSTPTRRHRARERGVAPDPSTLREPWLAAIGSVVEEATLAMPGGEWMQGLRRGGGKQGVHTEHLGHLLSEMQFLQRAYPGSSW